MNDRPDEIFIGFYSEKVQRIPMWADNEWARCEREGITHPADLHLALRMIDHDCHVLRAGRTADPIEHALALTRKSRDAQRKLQRAAQHAAHQRLCTHFAMLDIGDEE